MHPAFVDSAGRDMVEYTHGRAGVAGVGVHEACNRAPPTLADTGVELSANVLWIPSRELRIPNQGACGEEKR